MLSFEPLRALRASSKECGGISIIGTDSQGAILFSYEEPFLDHSVTAVDLLTFEGAGHAIRRLWTDRSSLPRSPISSADVNGSRTLLAITVAVAAKAGSATAGSLTIYHSRLIQVVANQEPSFVSVGPASGHPQRLVFLGERGDLNHVALIRDGMSVAIYQCKTTPRAAEKLEITEVKMEDRPRGMLSTGLVWVDWDPIQGKMYTLSRHGEAGSPAAPALSHHKVSPAPPQPPPAAGGACLAAGDFVMRAWSLAKPKKPEVALETFLTVSADLFAPHFSVVSLRGNLHCLCAQQTRLYQQGHVGISVTLYLMPEMISLELFIPFPPETPREVALGSRAHCGRICDMVYVFVPGVYLKFVDVSFQHEPCEGLAFGPDFVKTLDGSPSLSAPFYRVMPFFVSPRLLESPHRSPDSEGHGLLDLSTGKAYLVTLDMGRVLSLFQRGGPGSLKDDDAAEFCEARADMDPPVSPSAASSSLREPPSPSSAARRPSEELPPWPLQDQPPEGPFKSHEEMMAKVFHMVICHAHAPELAGVVLKSVFLSDPTLLTERVLNEYLLASAYHSARASLLIDPVVLASLPISTLLPYTTTFVGPKRVPSNASMTGLQQQQQQLAQLQQQQQQQQQQLGPVPVFTCRAQPVTGSYFVLPSSSSSSSSSAGGVSAEDYPRPGSRSRLDEFGSDQLARASSGDLAKQHYSHHHAPHPHNVHHGSHLGGGIANSLRKLIRFGGPPARTSWGSGSESGGNDSFRSTDMEQDPLSSSMGAGGSGGGLNVNSLGSSQGAGAGGGGGGAGPSNGAGGGAGGAGGALTSTMSAPPLSGSLPSLKDLASGGAGTSGADKEDTVATAGSRNFQLRVLEHLTALLPRESRKKCIQLAEHLKELRGACSVELFQSLVSCQDPLASPYVLVRPHGIYSAYLNLFCVIEELAFPLPVGLRERLGHLGAACLPRTLFLQHLDRGVFKLTHETLHLISDSVGGWSDVNLAFIYRLARMMAEDGSRIGEVLDIVKFHTADRKCLAEYVMSASKELSDEFAAEEQGVVGYALRSTGSGEGTAASAAATAATAASTTEPDFIPLAVAVGVVKQVSARHPENHPVQTAVSYALGYLDHLAEVDDQRIEAAKPKSSHHHHHHHHHPRGSPSEKRRNRTASGGQHDEISLPQQM